MGKYSFQTHIIFFFFYLINLCLRWIYCKGIYDDGSTDSTADIINSFEDNRIRIINQSNKGPGQARNNGLKIALGDYIMFLDADDWFCEDALKTAYFEAKNNNADISIFQIIKYFNGQFSQNDWFNLNNFDKSFENRVFHFFLQKKLAPSIALR